MTKKILIVEDEKNLIKVIEDTLLEESFLTYKALDGETALDMFYEQDVYKRQIHSMLCSWNSFSFLADGSSRKK